MSGSIPGRSGVYEDEADLAGRRLTRGLVWVRDSPDDDNGYAHPVENVIVIFDLHDMAVVRVEDYGVVPVPAKNAQLRPGRRRDRCDRI